MLNKKNDNLDYVEVEVKDVKILFPLVDDKLVDDLNFEEAAQFNIVESEENDEARDKLIFKILTNRIVIAKEDINKLKGFKDFEEAYKQYGAKLLELANSENSDDTDLKA